MRLVVYWTAAERRVLRWSGGRLWSEAAFAADDAGLAAFRGFLTRCAGAVVALVADVAGEEFHEERIPYLGGGDRAAIVERRIAQRFRDARLAAAWSLGRIAGGRRDERLLLASFADAAQFAPWLDALAASRARLAGVYSTALFAPALAALAAVRDPHCIVVSAHASGLRECFLEDGRLRFARFEPIQAAATEDYAARVRSEIERLAQYLGTLRALPADPHPLPVRVVASDALRTSLERALVSDARMAFRVESLEEAARRQGLRGAPEDLGAEQLALALAANKPVREQYARGEDRLGFVQWRLRRVLLAAGALGLSACAAYAGAQWIDVLELREQARMQRLAAREAVRSYERAATAFPATPTSAENLRAVVQEMRRIAARTAPPEAALAHVARALEACPQVELTSIVWNVRPLAAPEPGATRSLAQSLEISGFVTSVPRIDMRAMNTHIQRFATALQADPAWQVVRTELPFDMTPQGTLKGGGEAAASGAAPRFVIMISRPLG